MADLPHKKTFLRSPPLNSLLSSFPLSTEKRPTGRKIQRGNSNFSVKDFGPAKGELTELLKRTVNGTVIDFKNANLRRAEKWPILKTFLLKS
ncbi:hypothetical protein BFP77_01810 [Maribacter sp. 4U21]|uniref:hypothetical protein n=1 Tax=Maribacter sp. 4U21 TaxID=1889779 RepID=UPI000C145B6E|nr:hypothetical protein [Maribacter sp. 4U21]PIB31328.1 hypothetical protein BFP77_01810 [Maribacter sp. 4U21]